jgi:hypothetical protein
MKKRETKKTDKSKKINANKQSTDSKKKLTIFEQLEALGSRDTTEESEGTVSIRFFKRRKTWYSL